MIHNSEICETFDSRNNLTFQANFSTTKFSPPSCPNHTHLSFKYEPLFGEKIIQREFGRQII